MFVDVVGTSFSPIIKAYHEKPRKITNNHGSKRKTTEKPRELLYYLSRILVALKSRSELGTGKTKKPLKSLESSPFRESMIFPVPAFHRSQSPSKLLKTILCALP
ncbi:MAG: hypothetical protein B1H02_00535 [Candidatus Latescibacteria bacterium 4484_107]|nr:MAG: hypothetical protein B1H02_00535 [Candidatus Latescibacteria bacterium 4484_107]